MFTVAGGKKMVLSLFDRFFLVIISWDIYYDVPVASFPLSSILSKFQKVSSQKVNQKKVDLPVLCQVFNFYGHDTLRYRLQAS